MSDMILATVFLLGGVSWAGVMLAAAFNSPTGTFFPLASILIGGGAALFGFGWWVTILWALIF